MTNERSKINCRLEEQRKIEMIYMKRTLCEKVHYSGSRENFGNDAIKFQRLAFRCCFFPFPFLFFAEPKPPFLECILNINFVKNIPIFNFGL